MPPALIPDAWLTSPSASPASQGSWCPDSPRQPHSPLFSRVGGHLLSKAGTKCPTSLSLLSSGNKHPSRKADQPKKGKQKQAAVLAHHQPRGEETSTHPSRLLEQDPGGLCLAQTQLQPHRTGLDELLQDTDTPPGKAVLRSDRGPRPHAILLLLFLSLSFANIWNRTENRIKRSAVLQPAHTAECNRPTVNSTVPIH